MPLAKRRSPGGGGGGASLANAERRRLACLRRIEKRPSLRRDGERVSERLLLEDLERVGVRSLQPATMLLTALNGDVLVGLGVRCDSDAVVPRLVVEADGVITENDSVEWLDVRDEIDRGFVGEVGREDEAVEETLFVGDVDRAERNERPGETGLEEVDIIEGEPRSVVDRVLRVGIVVERE